jgi:hypothetical protein
MRSGRASEIRSALSDRRLLAAPSAVLALAAALLLSALAWRSAVHARFLDLRTGYREGAAAAADLRRDRAMAPQLRSAIESIGRRTARKEALREVFDPIVAPDAVETSDVSYQVTPADNGAQLYAIRFTMLGDYVDIARFLARLEGGDPIAVVERLELKLKDEGKNGEEAVRGEATVLVPAR